MLVCIYYSDFKLTLLIYLNIAQFGALSKATAPKQLVVVIGEGKKMKEKKQMAANMQRKRGK